MSSHHVIRDNQEPAVIFWGFENYNREVLGDVLEWSPFILAIEDGAHHLVKEGIKVDLALFLKDSAQKEEFDEYVLQMITTQTTLLKSGLQELEKRNHRGAYIFARFASLHLPDIERSKLTVSVIDDNLRWSFIKSGNIRKWYPKDAVIHFSCPEDLRSSGGIDFDPNDTTGRVEKDGMVDLNSTTGFWLGEYIA